MLSATFLLSYAAAESPDTEVPLFLLGLLQFCKDPTIFNFTFLLPDLRCWRLKSGPSAELVKRFKSLLYTTVWKHLSLLLTAGLQNLPHPEQEGTNPCPWSVGQLHFFPLSQIQHRHGYTATGTNACTAAWEAGSEPSQSKDLVQEASELYANYMQKTFWN